MSGYDGYLAAESFHPGFTPARVDMMGTDRAAQRSAEPSSGGVESPQNVSPVETRVEARPGHMSMGGFTVSPASSINDDSPVGQVMTATAVPVPSAPAQVPVPDPVQITAPPAAAADARRRHSQRDRGRPKVRQSHQPQHHRSQQQQAQRQAQRQPMEQRPQQVWNWSQNPEQAVLERMRQVHGSETSSANAAPAPEFDWTESLEQEALARAREVSRQQHRTQQQDEQAGGHHQRSQSQQALQVVYEDIPSATQALWQAYNPQDHPTYRNSTQQQPQPPQPEASLPPLPDGQAWRSNREQRQGDGARARDVSASWNGTANAGVGAVPITAGTGAAEGPTATRWSHQEGNNQCPRTTDLPPNALPTSPPRVRQSDCLSHQHLSQQRPEEQQHCQQEANQQQQPQWPPAVAATATDAVPGPTHDQQAATAGLGINQNASTGHGHGHGQPQTEAQTQTQARAQAQGRGPFMHYEDVTYFDPDPAAAKEELFHNAGLREAETFDTVQPPKTWLGWGWGGFGGSGSKPPKNRYTRSSRKNPGLGGVGVGVPTSWGRSFRTFCLAWTPEMLWCLFSAVCVAALAGVLYLYDGHALQDWPLGISLNALVAFLVTLCHAAFVVPILSGLAQLKWNWFARGERPLRDFQLFEDAGRSPWGTLRLLFSDRGRALGILGTVLLLTGLASSGITQIAVAFPTRLGTAVVGVANVGVSQGYTTSLTYGLDTRQIQAIQNGLFQRVNESLPALSPDCTTGNCQFPTFSSLAICTAVADVSSRLNISSAFSITSTAPPYGDLTVYNASLPNGVYLVGGLDTNLLNMSSTSSLRPEDPAVDTLVFSTQQNLMLSAIADFFVVYTNESWKQAGQSQPGTRSNEPGVPGNFRAVEILFHFCVNEYTAAVTSDIASTTLLSSTADVVATTVNGSTITLSDPTASSYTGMPSGDEGSASASSYTGGNYTITRASLAQLYSYMTGLFQGSYRAQLGAGPDPSPASGAFGAALYQGDDEGGVSGGQAPGDGDMSNVLNDLVLNVATGLTNAIRSTSTASVPGTAYTTETYIQVQWPWLAFLAAQVGLAACFLAGIMVQTAVWKVRVIKNSGLAALMAISADDRALLERQVGVGGVESRGAMARKLDTITGRFRLGLFGDVLDVGRKGVGVQR